MNFTLPKASFQAFPFNLASCLGLAIFGSGTFEPFPVPSGLSPASSFGVRIAVVKGKKEFEERVGASGNEDAANSEGALRDNTIS